MASTAVKRYIDAAELSNLSLELAMRVYAHDVKPTWVVGLWRGGVVPGIMVQGYLEYRGVHTTHIPIRTRSYRTDGTQQHVIEVYGLNHIVDHANEDDVLLLVDDIFDSGRSIEAVIRTLKEKMRANMPKTVLVATVFYKPENNKTSPRIVPDIVCETTNDWLVFPHEFADLGNIEEIERVMGARIANTIRPQEKKEEQQFASSSDDEGDDYVTLSNGAVVPARICKCARAIAAESFDMMYAQRQPPQQQPATSSDNDDDMPEDIHKAFNSAMEDVATACLPSAHSNNAL